MDGAAWIGNISKGIEPFQKENVSFEKTHNYGSPALGVNNSIHDFATSVQQESC